MCRRKYHIWVTNQDWAKEGDPPRLSAYVGTSVMADHTRLRIMSAMHYACFAPFWRFGKSRWVSLRAPCAVCFSSHERVRLRKRERVFSSTRERVNSSAKAFRSTRLSRRRRIIFLSPPCALFRRAHRRVHHWLSLRLDAPEDSISVIAAALEINRKQWESRVELITINVASGICYLKRSAVYWGKKGGGGEVSRSYREAFLQLRNIIFC